MPPLLSPSPSRPAWARWSAHGLVRLVPQSPGTPFTCPGTRPQHPGAVDRSMDVADGKDARLGGVCRHGGWRATTTDVRPRDRDRMHARLVQECHLRYDYCRLCAHHAVWPPRRVLPAHHPDAFRRARSLGVRMPTLLPRRGLAVVGHVHRSQHHAEPAKHRTPDSSMTVYLAVRRRARGWWWRLLATTNTVLTRRAARSRGRAHGSWSIRACRPFRTAPILRALSIKLSPL